MRNKAFAQKDSVEQDTEMEAVLEGSREGEEVSNQGEKAAGRKRIIQLMIVIAAAACILVGILQEEHWEVFIKAVKICLECIGIG